MHPIIVIDPDWQLFEHGAGVGFVTDASVVALEGSDERLGHSIALWAFDGSGSRNQTDVAREAASIVRGVAAAVIGQPFDCARHAVHLAEAVLDGGDHEVAHVLGGDTAGCRDVAHRFPITAIEREGDAHLFTVVAADLEPVGAPPGVAGVDSDPAVVPAFLTAAAVPLEEQAM